MAAATALPNDPSDAAWQKAPEYQAKLLLQDLVEPRLMKASTEALRVRALSNGSEAAFRLEWNAPIAERCVAGREVPGRVCHSASGEDRAQRARAANGRSGPAGRDHLVARIVAGNRRRPRRYDSRHLPAGRGGPLSVRGRRRWKKARPPRVKWRPAMLPPRALSNAMTGPRKTPVQDLLAEGPGTIMPAPNSASRGCGKRTPHGWAVVIVRRLPSGLTATMPSQVAFAVWQGAKEETGARKMRTGWVPLTLETNP